MKKVIICFLIVLQIMCASAFAEELHTFAGIPWDIAAEDFVDEMYSKTGIAMYWQNSSCISFKEQNITISGQTVLGVTAYFHEDKLRDITISFVEDYPDHTNGITSEVLSLYTKQLEIFEDLYKTMEKKYGECQQPLLCTQQTFYIGKSVNNRKLIFDKEQPCFSKLAQLSAENGYVVVQMEFGNITLDYIVIDYDKLVVGNHIIYRNEVYIEDGYDEYYEYVIEGDREYEDVNLDI